MLFLWMHKTYFIAVAVVLTIFVALGWTVSSYAGPWYALGALFGLWFGWGALSVLTDRSTYFEPFDYFLIVLGGPWSTVVALGDVFEN